MINSSIRSRSAATAVPAQAPAPSSDEMLVARIAGGDRLAMQTLFARHRTPVYRWFFGSSATRRSPRNRLAGSSTKTTARRVGCRSRQSRTGQPLRHRHRLRSRSRPIGGRGQPGRQLSILLHRRPRMAKVSGASDDLILRGVCRNSSLPLTFVILRTQWATAVTSRADEYRANARECEQLEDMVCARIWFGTASLTLISSITLGSSSLFRELFTRFDTGRSCSNVLRRVSATRRRHRAP
jgi:hypothetical protein